jgi:redox-sensitive bicupin YhaK (pirin superfamily)
MSWHSCPDAVPGHMQVAESIETVIVPRAHDLGGFEFRRALPSRMRLEPGAALLLGTAHEERAVYVVSGVVNIDGDRFPSGQLLVLRPDAIAVSNAENEATRLVLVGGVTMDGPRHIWWNFVSSRPDWIEQAKADWKAGRFDIVPGDAEEFIPLPDADDVASYP